MTTIRFDVHHYIHYAAADAKLDAILSRLDSLVAQGVVMSQELDTLKAKVAETTTVEQSAIELLNGLGQQIAALKTDPAALQALADSLGAKSAELAAAVAANTPAAPTP